MLKWLFGGEITFGEYSQIIILVEARCDVP
jgi:hypothetical protein